MHQRLEGHSSYVKGVCVDPLGHYIVSQSTDKSIRVFACTKLKKNVNFLCKHHVRRKLIKKNIDNNNLQTPKNFNNNTNSKQDINEEVMMEKNEDDIED